MALGAKICHGYQVHQFQASLCNNSTKIHSLNYTEPSFLKTPCERKRRVCRQLATVYAGIAGASSSHRSSLSNAGVVKRTLARCLSGLCGLLCGARATQVSHEKVLCLKSGGRDESKVAPPFCLGAVAKLLRYIDYWQTYFGGPVGRGRWDCGLQP